MKRNKSNKPKQYVAALAMHNNSVWEDWRDAIRDRPNPTSANVNELFDNYN